MLLSEDDIILFVKAIYPEAILCSDENRITQPYIIRVQNAQKYYEWESIGYFSNTHFGAWESAFNRIQMQMLERLEK